jgi:arylsulfatase A
VPLIARWPGKVPAGTTANHISAFWDLLPTLADMTGAEVPDNLDGISFLPTLLRKGQQRAHPYLYWEFHERGGRVALRQGKWKAIKYDYLKAPDAPFELYDLDRDPGENQNIAADHPALLADFEKLLKNARTDSDVFAFGSKGYLQKE